VLAVGASALTRGEREGLSLSKLGEYVKAHTIDKDMSIRKVAAEAGLGMETVRALLTGTRKTTSDATLEALAKAFPALNLGRMRELAGRSADDPRPFEVPREWDLLTEEERRVLKAVGRQILRSSGRLDAAAEDDQGDVTQL
jgi:hypothetical protein